MEMKKYSGGDTFWSFDGTRHMTLLFRLDPVQTMQTIVIHCESFEDDMRIAKLIEMRSWSGRDFQRRRKDFFLFVFFFWYGVLVRLYRWKFNWNPSLMD